jgi:four helix bundle protein
LNIAEGAGELARREKARFYRMARRSATECAAILDIAWELELAPEEQLREGRQQLQRIVKMLVALGKRMGGGTEKAEARAGAEAGDSGPFGAIR